MLLHKQQSQSGHLKSQHLFYPPTDLERCRTGEVGSQWGNASFLPLKWLLLILVSPEDAPRLMGVLVGLTLQQFLIEKKHLKKKKEAESHCPLARENCSCLSLIPSLSGWYADGFLKSRCSWAGSRASCHLCGGRHWNSSALHSCLPVSCFTQTFLLVFICTRSDMWPCPGKWMTLWGPCTGDGSDVTAVCSLGLDELPLSPVHYCPFREGEIPRGSV